MATIPRFWIKIQRKHMGFDEVSPQDEEQIGWYYKALERSLIKSDLEAVNYDKMIFWNV